jgi:hypothetical protein
MVFLFVTGKRTKEIFDDVSVTLGEKRSYYLTVKNQVSQFKTGHFSTATEDRLGRPFVFTA